MADNFFKNRNGIALGVLSVAPSNPKNGDFYYNTTLNKFQRYENGAWGSFGSGGGGGSSKNYLSAYTASTASGVPNTGNGDFEAGNTTGFSLGTVTLTSNFPSGVPTFGSGASGNLSLSVISSAQLAGLYSLGYTSSAATTAGNFVATDAFFIDKEDQTKMMAFSFAYNAFANASNGNFSGTSSNSFGVAIYDVTNSAWIQPAGVFNLTQNAFTGICTGTFQATANSTQYRVVVYNANATAGAITMYFDDFVCGPQGKVLGPAMTDWTAYTPTISGFGTTTNVNFTWARVGDTLFVRGYYTGGTSPGAVLGTFTLPNGYTIDTAKMTINNTTSNPGERVGWILPGTSSGQITPLVTATGTSASLIYIGAQPGATANTTPTNVGSVISNGQNITLAFAVPISGWSSNSVMSQDTDTRVVAASYFVSGSVSTTSATQINFDSKILDTHGAVTTGVGSWKFTAPISGFYEITGNVAQSLSSTAVQIYKNGSAYIYASLLSASNQPFPFTGIVQLNAGEFVDARFTNTTTTDGSGTPYTCVIHIKRLSGPAVVAASESVNAMYGLTGAQAVTAGNQIKYDTKIKDSHNAFSTSTGLYTVPVSGCYSVSVQSQAGAAFDLYIRVNSVDRSYILGASASGFVQPGTILVQLNAGDTFGIYSDASVTFGAPSTHGYLNYLSISRVGN